MSVRGGGRYPLTLSNIVLRGPEGVTRILFLVENLSAADYAPRHRVIRYENGVQVFTVCFAKPESALRSAWRVLRELRDAGCVVTSRDEHLAGWLLAVGGASAGGFAEAVEHLVWRLAGVQSPGLIAAGASARPFRLLALGAREGGQCAQTGRRRSTNALVPRGASLLALAPQSVRIGANGANGVVHVA